MDGDVNGLNIRDMTEDVECLCSLLHLTLVFLYNLHTLSPHYKHHFYLVTL